MRRAVFLDRDGVLNRAVPQRRQTVSAVPRSPNCGVLSGRSRRVPQTAGGRLRFDPDHQSAGYRPRPLSAPGRCQQMNRRAAALSAIWTTSASARTTMRRAAPAANHARPAARSRARLEYRSGVELYCRRPLARHRSRPSRGLPGGFCRPWLSPNGVRTVPICESVRCARPRNGFCEPARGEAAVMPDGVHFCSLAAQVSEPRPATLRVKIFADGADRALDPRTGGNPLIGGFTTNPTPDAQSGRQRLRVVWASTGAARFRIVHSPSKCSRTISTKWSSRRCASPPGAKTCT